MVGVAIARDSVIIQEGTDTRSGGVLYARKSSGSGEPFAGIAAGSHPGFRQAQTGAWASVRLGCVRVPGGSLSMGPAW